MKYLAAAIIALASPAGAQPASFDGVWAVTVACPAVADAAGYTLRFPARIDRGELLGENGTPGSPGFLRLSGHVQSDGNAVLAAEGLVGSPRVAIGHVASLTPYRYNAPTRFVGGHGTGSRNSVRPCSLDFVRG
jgi:hypothetical protein